MARRGNTGGEPLTIIRDTREQRPLDFTPFPNVRVEVASLWPGDYTVKGFERSVAFERKSVSDLIGTMKGGYAGRHSIRRYESRFDLELEEFERHYDRFYILVEPDLPEVIRSCRGQPCGAEEQILRGWYRSAIEPIKVVAFLRSLEDAYGCHIYLAEDREDSAWRLVEAARRYVESRRHVIHRGRITKGERVDESPF